MTAARRIIPCLDVRGGRVVKGVRFRGHRDLGDVLDFAQRYRDAGADELVFYDITASPDGRSVDPAWIARISRRLDIPFCVAGGIRNVETAEAILHAGADKVSVNAPALERPVLIEQLAKRFGSQCVVVGIDSAWTGEDWQVRSHTGRTETTRSVNRRTLDWVREAQLRGAGEIVLNCMDSDGVRSGYDVAQLRAVREQCRVPLVASGGAGGLAHFADVFENASVDAALAASVFHTGSIPIPELKTFLDQKGIPVRL